MPEIGMFDPLAVLLTAALNPVVVIVGFLMGRASDQWQKLLVAGFAAALAGAVAIWIANRLGLISLEGAGTASGIFMLSLVFGTAWAAIGYAIKPSQADSGPRQD
jgi:hypothetical protein